MNITELAPGFSVGPQIETDDLNELAREGFTDIVCNRPDEEHPDGPVSTQMADRAAALGLAFHYLPIVHGEPFTAQAQRLAELTGRPGAKVFAYCRSGARSANAWTLSVAGATHA